MKLNGHWLFPDQMQISQMGFVYCIRDDYMKEIYFGKKSYKGKGRLNMGEESNWKKYLSSSSYVRNMLTNRPHEEFSFITLEEFSTPSGLAFAEVWAITSALCPQRKDCGNVLVPKISYNVKEQFTDRFLERFQRATLFESFDDEKEKQ